MPIVKNNRSQIFGNHLMSLKPGVNEVDPKVWVDFKRSPAIAHYIAEGEIEELDFPTANPDSPVQIDDLNQKEALALVKATFDKTLLERWAANESRKGVLDALEKQMDAIALKSKEEVEDAEDEDAEGEEA